MAIRKQERRGGQAIARSDTSFPRASVPESEIELFEQQIRAKPQYGDPKFIIGAYRAVGLNVLPDPFSAQVVAVIAGLRRKYPESEFEHVAVGKSWNTGHPDAAIAREFLLEAENALSGDLRGCLCLVGAGVWAEIYCTWIKRNGGVGVDIGSGFDLLACKATRAVHQSVLGASGNRFALG